MTTAFLALAEKVGKVLKERHLKLVTAESCTGGGLSFWITAIPGSSDWFERGLVTYSNEAKEELLGVKKETLERFGAVSEETACEMAKGALKYSHGNISIAITGIAGPTGGSLQKPVGTVWIAYAGKNYPTKAIGDIYTGSREEVRNQVIERAMQELLHILNQ